LLVKEKVSRKEQKNMALKSISAASERWGVSKFTTRRLIDAGYVRSVTISSRRLIPEEEVERVAREGAGKPRYRKAESKHLPKPQGAQ
jgi:excisionase family DNA binding protein